MSMNLGGIDLLLSYASLENFLSNLAFLIMTALFISVLVKREYKIKTSFLPLNAISSYMLDFGLLILLHGLVGLVFSIFMALAFEISLVEIFILALFFLVNLGIGSLFLNLGPALFIMGIPVYSFSLIKFLFNFQGLGPSRILFTIIWLIFILGVVLGNLKVISKALGHIRGSSKYLRNFAIVMVFACLLNLFLNHIFTLRAGIVDGSEFLSLIFEIDISKAQLSIGFSPFHIIVASLLYFVLVGVLDRFFPQVISKLEAIDNKKFNLLYSLGLIIISIVMFIVLARVLVDTGEAFEDNIYDYFINNIWSIYGLIDWFI